MQKYRDSDIKSFEFSDLKGTHVIEKNPFQPFEFKPLDGESIRAQNISEEELRTERKYAQSNNFKVDDIVRDYRGLSRQEQSDLELKIQVEVKKRVDEAYKIAHKEGYEKGIEEGKQFGLNEFNQTVGQKVETIEKVITDVREHSENLIKNNRQEIYDFVKRFTKWVILKEIDDKVYLEKLFEKLVLELGARKNLIVKVGKLNFKEMPEIVKIIEEKIGHLSNLRIELVPDINAPGIILESENGLIDGSIEGVFQNIDKIFEQVTINE